MPTQNDALIDRLSRYREITITVTGRKSGRAISIPVWFVLEDDKLHLLPVQGSDTQWYKNVLKKPTIRISARGAEAEFEAVPITDAARVSSVIDKFRAKYGAGDVKKYYSKFDVAVLAEMQ
ncbi:MAG: nitroreductase/quinone reductase family protein [Terriglobales bacterium]|jgi:deazaflavin-dependent oxidoreductase (nitroreductase family)